MTPNDLEKYLKLMVKYRVNKLELENLVITKDVSGELDESPLPKTKKVKKAEFDPYNNDPIPLDEVLGSLMGDLPPEIEEYQRNLRF